MTGTAVATTQTQAWSVIRARRICVLMLLPLQFGVHHARIAGVTEIGQ
jgi:hypothetical protein